MENGKYVLLICGFHRSATSATASYLHNAGLDLGANLMAGSISNAKGHFEDREAVQLHDNLLENSSTDWQFHDECQLESSTDTFQQYVDKRNSDSTYWGVKDPRACLFLDDWNEVLGDSGRYLFIVRHWSNCIESLLHRHSRELAHNMGNVDVNHAGLKFWLDVSLAAKMWLSYNKRLLDFAQKNNEKVLLVTQRALFEGAPVLDFLNDKFGFNLNTEVNSPFDPQLLRDQASESIRNSLSYSLCTQLDKVHDDLLALSHFKSNDETPLYIKPYNIPANDFVLLHEAIKKVPTQDNKKTIDNQDVAADWLEKVTLLSEPSEIIQQLNSASLPLIKGLQVERLQNVIDEKFNLNGNVILAFAKLLVRKQSFQLAILYFQKVVTLGSYFPFVDMLIGQCYQGLFHDKQAEFFFNKAIKANPNNAIFYTNKAKFLVSNNHIEQAEAVFKQGYEKGVNNPSNVLPYCEYLMKNKQESKAEKLLLLLIKETNNSHAKNMLIQLTLMADFNSGKERYLINAKEKIADKNKYAWLAGICTLLSLKEGENDLINRVLLHWKDVESL